MTRTEIEKRIEQLGNWEFMLQMKDRWITEDYEQSRKWNAEIRHLEKELEGLK